MPLADKVVNIAPPSEKLLNGKTGLWRGRSFRLIVMDPHQKRQCLRRSQKENPVRIATLPHPEPQWT